MASWIRQSTSVDVGIGPFLDETDGKTAETALTITQPDIRLKKNNGNWAQKNAAQTLSHEEAGWYEVTLDATDTNTLGLLIVAIHESGALPVWKEYMVVPAQVWDSYLATDVLQVDMAQWNNTNIATPDTAGYPKVTIKDGTGTGEIDTASGKVSLVAGDITSIQSGLATSASIAALNNISAAQVNAEVLDVINVDTFAEIGQEAPAATQSIRKMVGYLYKFLRNRVTQDATTLKVYGDDAVTVHQKATVSDSGSVYDRGEIATGP